MRKILAAALVLMLASTGLPAKPPSGGGGGGGGGGGSSPPPNAEVGYRSASGKSVKLMVANADGTNATALYSSSASFSFDLGPPSKQALAIVDHATNSRLRLLTYETSGSGYLQQVSVDDLTAADRSSPIDFSPDGTKIAYMCCSNGIDSFELRVYDLTSRSSTVWGRAPFYWSVAWFRGGNSIAYSTHEPGRSQVFELTGPGATPQLLYTSGGEINIDASHADSNSLLLSYNDEGGDARIGLFDADSKSFSDPDLANSARSFFGNLDCSDRRLAYMRPTNSGMQAFYIRELNTGLESLFAKAANIRLQFFPCG